MTNRDRMLACLRHLLRRLGEWNLAAARQMLEAGVDCVVLCDDLGSNDSMLVSPAVKREYGRRLTLVGGLPKQFFTLAPGPMEQVLRETVAVCRPGGGFILMEASGVPDTVSADTWRQYATMLRELRWRSVDENSDAIGQVGCQL